MSAVNTPAFQTGHIGINVTNIEKSKQFYQSVFGFTVSWEADEPGHCAFLSDGQKLILTLWEQSEGTFAKDRPGLHHLSFRVNSIEDVRFFENKLKLLDANLLYQGIVPHGEGQDSGGIFFTDPDGIRLEIYSPVRASEYPAPVASAPTCGFF
ncbi:VOC family protein [Tengunoibacter tsumagoiensis]|uniref:Lactoylglutathione lyase n=1 Tax=Tengunoibacter tsumagoiensis TaxID=2014871 RepID=A0A401ZYI4_9CHLR|nr:VOC family protein [Tengunoibacter tsumagoiensis]GCE11909.1 lactoylglutathione lyase [Tengunoibacter tsumagoiensis]